MGLRKIKVAMLMNRILLAALALIVAGETAVAQNDRRQRTEPGLVVETGAPTASEQVIAFTPTGDQLFAAGLDKVCRRWEVGPQGFGKGTALRWSVWKERRGAIYALALS